MLMSLLLYTFTQPQSFKFISMGSPKTIGLYLKHPLSKHIAYTNRVSSIVDKSPKVGCRENLQATELVPNSENVFMKFLLESKLELPLFQSFNIVPLN